MAVSAEAPVPQPAVEAGSQQAAQEPAIQPDAAADARTVQIAAQAIAAAGNPPDPNNPTGDPARNALAEIAGGMGRKLNPETGKLEIGMNSQSLQGLNVRALEMQQSQDVTEQATGIDLQIAVLQYQLASTEAQLAKISSNRPDQRRNLEDHQKQIKLAIIKIQTKREPLKDASGNKIESLTEQVSRVAVNDQEKTESANNPIGFMEGRINAIMRSRDSGQLTSLLTNLGLGQEEMTYLNNLTQGIKVDESKQNQEKWIGRGKKAGIFAIIAALLMAWMGSKKNQGQQGQGMG